MIVCLVAVAVVAATVFLREILAELMTVYTIGFALYHVLF